MQRALLLLAIVLLACAGGCASVWPSRSIPACQVPIGDARLDGERSYYAALIAASDRKYVIERAEAPRQLEIEYHSAYKPEQAYAHWLIEVAPDASLAVKSLPDAAPVSRRRTRRLDQWFSLLSDSARRLSCRELNWLRWEAQNRGLVPMVEGLSANAVETAGAESPAETTASAAPLLDAATIARRNQLERERNEISLVGPIAMLATGVGVLGGAIGLTEMVLVDLQQDCGDAEGDSPCLSARTRRNLAIGAGAAGAVAIALLATGAPFLAKRLRNKREIGRELRLLQEPRVSLGADAHGLELSLSARF